jgi:D-alanyl-D-alanine carboxypeptidase
VDGAALDEALARSAEVHGPGLLGFVTEGGEVAYEGAIGVADLRHPRPIGAHDQFRIGSVTKIYVAVVVLQRVRPADVG